MTRNGALAGMVVGAAVVLLWNHYAWWGLYEIIPGFVLASLSIYVVSLLDKAPDTRITAVFDTVKTEILAIK